ncbi:porin family protein [Aliivibrio finisterrensis]|uniref:outer membrane beta-barrel protein n=1 Tax=Aliivibrio finisterrensis TaxID=511998 RepID=UPI00101ED4B5|nr:outer membrane beta-barrel protein [Aliivibrio finisterrensis]RYU66688.1 porin family protein [Aliivibrio finisterrensis]RYU69757.1 porin family protein [Aliivibrio finisterrensis]RYU73544.1 porin family protein [Aliivibrio finisterrensis]
MNKSAFRLATLLIGSLSTSVYANNIGHLYFGADLNINNEIKLDGFLAPLTEVSDIGYNAHLGFLFNTHELVNLGIEAEYRQLGQSNHSNVMIYKGSATFINIKPKFVNSNTQLYSAVLLGIGKVDSHFQTYDATMNYRSTGYQYGIEVGYDFKSGISSYLGYKALKINEEIIELTSTGLYAGMSYSF